MQLTVASGISLRLTEGAQPFIDAILAGDAKPPWAATKDRGPHRRRCGPGGGAASEAQSHQIL